MKTTTRPGYGGKPAKNINTPVPTEPVKRVQTSFSKIPGGK
jgi:hypothetical protein